MKMKTIKPLMINLVWNDLINSIEYSMLHSQYISSVWMNRIYKDIPTISQLMIYLYNTAALLSNSASKVII